ncbi:MAG: Gfo/Idh/MocA family oxidoreductase [Acidobacteria bacterium]|nr:Gfo/Idh/MocA family oxidoreductase [Acidobacteriota bacterium]
MGDTRLRVAVVGVGHLGKHHARLLAQMPGVELVAVADIDAGRAAEIAAAHATTGVIGWQALPSDLDAVTIAVPTEVHLPVALGLIERGMHVLVEKPLARSVAEADTLIAAAAGRVQLAVGHTERFNPAVTAARAHLRHPRFIEAHRLGTFPERSLDIDVVFDLMIHDLDLLLSIVGEPVVSVEAVGVPVLTPRIDIANVRLRFAGGCIANLTASRISRDRVRKIRFFQPQSYLSIDYAAQEVEHWTLGPGPAGTPAITGGKLDVPREEPLKRELEDFVAAVRDRRPPMVTGEAGRAALALAAEIVECMDHVR